MIVKKPIGAVKIGNTISRLTVGNPVPENVLNFWKDSGQINDLIKVGAISDENIKAEKKDKGKSKKQSDEIESQKGLIDGIV